MVHFKDNGTKRFDDPEEMGKAIAEFLQKHPRKTVKVEYYI